jgi:hypothetical protein
MRLSDPHGMKHTLVTPLVAAFSLCAASTAHAHHSWGANYDLCNFTIEGRVESIEWKNPHTWFVVKTDAGTLYHVEWTGLQILDRQGFGRSAQDAVTYGARVVVTGMPPKSAATIRANYPSFKDDPDPKVIGARRIRRADASFDWFALPGPLAPECAGR